VYSSSQKLWHTATGNSHAIWDHTVLPATRHRWESRLFPQPKQVLGLATPEGCKAELTYVTWKPTSQESTCESQVQRRTAEPPRNSHLRLLWSCSMSIITQCRCVCCQELSGMWGTWTLLKGCGWASNSKHRRVNTTGLFRVGDISRADQVTGCWSDRRECPYEASTEPSCVSTEDAPRPDNCCGTYGIFGEREAPTLLKFNCHFSLLFLQWVWLLTMNLFFFADNFSGFWCCCFVLLLMSLSCQIFLIQYSSIQ